MPRRTPIAPINAVGCARMIAMRSASVVIMSAFVALTGCEPAQPPQADAVETVRIDIDADSHCLLDQKVIRCESVGEFLRNRYPRSSPQLQVCPSKQSSYAPTAALLKSLQDARFPRIVFRCGSDK